MGSREDRRTRLTPGEQRRLLRELEDGPWLRLHPAGLALARALDRDVLAPLTGFLDREETEACLRDGRLPDGAPWPVPILLPALGPNLPSCGDEPVMLLDPSGESVGVLWIRELFTLDMARAASQLFGSTDGRHPGVSRFQWLGERFAAGRVEIFAPPCVEGSEAPAPLQVRQRIDELGLATTAGITTRTVATTGLELLVRQVLRLVDGVILQPVLGWRKVGEFTDTAVLASHRALLEGYLSPDRVLLAPVRLPTFFAGPREGLLHALIQRSFGATHTVIREAAAGVHLLGHPREALEIFQGLPEPGILPIPVLGIPHHCSLCGGMVTDRSCSHPREYRSACDAGEIRRWLQDGGAPPEHVARPDICEALQAVDRPLAGLEESTEGE